MKEIIESIKAFAGKSKRVWMILKKPTKKEFELISKISAIGILLLGVIGFIISIIISFFFTLFIIFSMVLVPYHVFTKYLKWLTLALFAYIFAGFIVKQDWIKIFIDTLVPQIELSPSYILLVVAIFGTTISPYLFFWQADEEVEEICKEVSQFGHVCAANYNSPGQVVISGEKTLLEKASTLAKERGAKMVVPLKVDGAFHSYLMNPASVKLSKELETTPISKSNIPIVANISARYVTEPDEIKTSLAKQLNSPVRWHQSICMLIRDGFDKFYEIGPGKSLSGLMKRIDPTQEIKNIDTTETLRNLIKSN